MAGVSGCIKYSMFIFNFLFWLCGIFILAVAIWIRVSKDGQELLSGGESGINPYVGVNILIAVGATIMVLGFLGCCGAIKESRCMLLLFFIGLFLILLLQVAAGILGAAFRSESERVLNETLHKNVELLSATTENAEVFQKALSEFQEEFKCCGLISGPADWGQNFEKYSKSCECPETQVASCISYDNKYVYNQVRTNQRWHSKNKPDMYWKEVFEKSCKIEHFHDDYLKPQPGNSVTDYRPKKIHSQGDNSSKIPCISFIKDLLKKHIIIIIGIAFGLAVIEILGLIFSMVLFCQIGSK